jgi:hypothetical protein
MPSASRQPRSPQELALALSGPLAQWLRAVEIERERVKDDLAEMAQRQADAALLVVAARNVVRVATAVAALQKDPVLDAAIAEVDKLVPGARNVPVLLEHFDEYSTHRILRRSRKVTGGTRVSYERTTERYVLYIGDLAFDVDVAADATTALADVTAKTIERLVGR